MKGTVTIEKKEYAELLKCQEAMSRLQSGGVDNWNWYFESLNPDGEQSLEDAETQIDAKVEAM